jgi:hypothetical protein
MAIYVPELPNKFDEGLIPFDIRAEYFSEYLGSTQLSDFMGSSNANIIRVFEMTGSGDSMRIPFERDIAYANPTTGYDQLLGSEQKVKTVYDSVSVMPYRWADGIQAVKFAEQLTPIKLFEQLRPQLMRANKKFLVESILGAATSGNAVHKGPYYLSATTKPSYDRIIVGSATPTRATYLGYAGLTTALNGLNGLTYDTGGLSVDVIRKTKSYAVNGGAMDIINPEPHITPTEILTKKGFANDKFVLLIDPLSYNSLCKDPQWAQLLYQGMTRGDNQPESISGARFRGEVEGVMIYECPELGHYRTTSQAGGKVAAWNLFMGAQAFALVWAERPWFAEEKQDYQWNVSMAVAEIRGQKALMYPSDVIPANEVEHGIIHLFTQVA